jgi:hypothetical protein
LTFATVTAFAFSCAVSTLLRGSCVTAQPVPVMEKTSAIVATTRAGEGRFTRAPLPRSDR